MTKRTDPGAGRGGCPALWHLGGAATVTAVVLWLEWMPLPPRVHADVLSLLGLGWAGAAAGYVLVRWRRGVGS